MVSSLSADGLVKLADNIMDGTPDHSTCAPAENPEIATEHAVPVPHSGKHLMPCLKMPYLTTLIPCLIIFL